MREIAKDIKQLLLRNWIWIILGLIATKHAVFYAYQDRGYMAIGGEYLVLPVILMIASMARSIAWALMEILSEGDDTDAFGTSTQKCDRRV